MRVAVVLEQHSAKVCFWYLCYYLFIFILVFQNTALNILFTSNKIIYKYMLLPHDILEKCVGKGRPLCIDTLYRYPLQTYLDSTSFSHYTLVMMLH